MHPEIITIIIIIIILNIGIYSFTMTIKIDMIIKNEYFCKNLN